MSKRRLLVLLIFVLTIILIIFSFPLIKINEYWWHFWIIISYSLFCDAINVKLVLRSIFLTLGTRATPCLEPRYLWFQPKSSCTCQACAVTNLFSGHSGVSRPLDQRLHRKDDVGAGCYDKRARRRPCNNDALLVVRWVGLAATAIAADDHNDDKDKNPANYSCLTHNWHVIPPGKSTLIKERLQNLPMQVMFSWRDNSKM